MPTRKPSVAPRSPQPGRTSRSRNTAFGAIKQQLAEDDLLDRETIEIPITSSREDDMIADLRALRERIRDRRGGEPIPLDILEQVRQERE
jgi:hypothetical protein